MIWMAGGLALFLTTSFYNNRATKSRSFFASSQKFSIFAMLNILSTIGGNVRLNIRAFFMLVIIVVRTPVPCG